MQRCQFNKRRTEWQMSYRNSLHMVNYANHKLERCNGATIAIQPLFMVKLRKYCWSFHAAWAIRQSLSIVYLKIFDPLEAPGLIYGFEVNLCEVRSSLTSLLLVAGANAIGACHLVPCASLHRIAVLLNDEQTSRRSYPIILPPSSRPR